MSQPQAQDAVVFLARLFPSFREVGPDEAARRTETLGLFVAQTWVAGTQGFQARGIDVPTEVHGKLAAVAPRVAQARQGGATFLAHVKAAFGDDARCAQAMSGFARVYAESLRGAGAAPPVAQPARPAPAAAAPAPSPAPTSGGFGDLDLLPEDAPPQRGASAPAPPSGRQPQVATPASGSGGLDLVDEEPEERPAAAAAVEMFLDPPSDAAAPAGAAPGAAGAPPAEKRPKKPLRGKPEEKPKEERPAEPSAPRDPAERGMWLFEREGNPTDLMEAQALLTRQLEQAPHAVAAAVAEAGLARVMLLKGDKAGAEKRARAALARDPSCPAAIEVLVRLQRGEAERSAFLIAVAQLRGPLGDHEVARAWPLAERLKASAPDEPHAFLALAYLSRLKGDREGFVTHVREAWTRWPSPRCDVAFGGEVDVQIAEALIGFGREGFKTNDEALLRKTVEDVDSKQNEVAGALRLAVAMSRAALARGPEKAVERHLAFAIGRALVGLQYYDAALPWLGRAGFLAPPVEEVKAIGNERINAGALRRAFDRPGIKAQLKAYKCPGLTTLTQRLKERLEAIRKDREEREQEMFQAGADLAEMARKDPAVAQEVARAIQSAKVQDPLAPLEAVARELDDVERERAEAKRAGEEQKGGLFGKLKAAVGDVTREAKLKLKESQAAAKRKEAAKRLAVVLGRDLSDVQWKSPALVACSRRLATVEAFMDYYETEERRAKEELERLAEATGP